MFPFPAFQEAFDQYRCCVLVPTYNNDGTLGAVIRGVQEYTRNIFVINDGSTDTTTTLLEAFSDITIISYTPNRGKGYALRQGFAAAAAAGYDYAISIDADGQHYPADLPIFLDALSQNPGALIIGARNLGATANVPGKSSFGNRFSNFWFKLYTGISAPDTQSGYRLYPLHAMSGMHFYTRKYEFEVEVIVRAAWKGIPLLSVPVQVYYPPAAERVSHFRPFKDFTRISVLNTVFFAIAFLYIKPRDFFRQLLKKNQRKELIQKLFEPGQTAERKAISIGFGIFMGIVPIWGFQLIVGISLAVLFRLNKALVIAAANISIPPMIPLIIYTSFLAGAPWMGNAASHLTLDTNLSLASIQTNLQQYLLGSVTLAIVAGLVIGLLSYLVMKWERIFSW
ncbi:DUF2062 domain-containing protein [Flavihumibacter petaseus]|uniref:Putative glycosyltransferase n=1 Tax=Flavihumibacter petaseus NBRC 106054 TaxID=1220578 RepID=A0A0E9MX75_9BACT|nr:DUF2062 domain-containing protein [Flavihumibacter petaseus]GAO42103.1 putative glycosyltransferase [Flavihumibacter petaseus NBRC 106054]